MRPPSGTRIPESSLTVVDLAKRLVQILDDDRRHAATVYTNRRRDYVVRRKVKIGSSGGQRKRSGTTLVPMPRLM